MSDTEEKTAVAEEDAEAVETTAQAAATGEEAEAGAKEEKAEEAAAEEKEGAEEKAEEVELPELTDDQRAALAKDPAMQKLVQAEGTEDLNAFIQATLAEAEKTKETEKEQAAERKTLEEAERAFREDNDPGPLAQIAADNLAKVRQRAAMSAEVDNAMYEGVRPFVEAEYGDTVRAMKPEEVKALDEMPLAEALQDLARRKAAASGGSEKEAANKAVQNAATAGAARSESGGTLPGGTAKEAVSDDIGTLMRQGMGDDDLDVEEAQGG
jgi:hypothetical protein